MINVNTKSVSAILLAKYSALSLKSTPITLRGRMLSIFGLIENVSLAIGSILYAHIITFGIQYPFLIMLALSFLAFILRLRLIETCREGCRKEIKNHAIPKLMCSRYTLLLKNVSAIALLTFSALLGLGHGLIFFAAPLYLMDVCLLPEESIGILYSLIPLSRIVLSYSAGYLADKHLITALSLGVLGPSILYIIAPFLAGHVHGFIVGLVLCLGSSLSLFEGNAYTKLANIILDIDLLATFMGLDRTVFTLMMSVGSGLLGLLYFINKALALMIAGALLIMALINTLT